jgi:hypothetical protein
MDILIEIVRWFSIVIICIGFIVLGKQVRYQARAIEKLQDDIDWIEEDIKITSATIHNLATNNKLKWHRINNLKDVEKIDE